MFTGLIEEVGVVRSLRTGAKSAEITVGASEVLGGLRVGDSVAVSGVCLTVTSLGRDSFTADVMAQTVRATNMAGLRPGARVNLERALRLGDRLGGHIVSGHIDGTGAVRGLWREDNAVWFTVAAPPEILRVVIPKGSIAMDGVSLTVAHVDDEVFGVSVIPHTRDATTLPDKQAGDVVNLECDVIGKYVEKLLAPASQQAESGLNLDFLAQHGFV